MNAPAVNATASPVAADPDAALLAAVRPPDRPNPSPRGRYDLVVIGAGTAGLVTAAGAAGLGARVALVERDRMGGDCLNVGCVPSKALLAAGRVAAAARRACAFGVTTAPVAVDFPAVMDRMRRLRADLATNDSAARFASLGVDVYFGDAAFAGPDSVTVDGRTLRFKRAAICTGARAAVPEIAGLRDSGFMTNETVFDLDALPRSLVVLGGGPIGCELGQAFARFGSRVTLVDRAERLLLKDDPDASAIVRRSLERDGVRVLTNWAAARVEIAGSTRLVHVAEASRGRSPDGTLVSGTPLHAEAVLVALGRRPNVDGLNLDAAGIAFDAAGVTVDDGLRTTNRRVYAAGDVCSPFKFTHAADAAARLLIRNALFPGRSKASALTIPWCTYTAPELAHVGLTAAEADARGTAIETFRQDFAGVDRSVTDGETEGFAAVHVRHGTDAIVGGTVVGAAAGDLVGYLLHAMTHGQGLRSFAETVFPYPTRAEVFRKLADASNRGRLTPGRKALLGTWLRWLR